MDITEKEQIINLTRQNGGEWTLNHTNRLLSLVERKTAVVQHPARQLPANQFPYLALS